MDVLQVPLPNGARGPLNIANWVMIRDYSNPQPPLVPHPFYHAISGIDAKREQWAIISMNGFGRPIDKRGFPLNYFGNDPNLELAMTQLRR